MNRLPDIPTNIYEDEIIDFLAERYHCTPKEIMQCFLAQNGMTQNTNEKTNSFILEENEMEILRGLTKDFLKTNFKKQQNGPKKLSETGIRLRIGDNLDNDKP